MTHIHVSTGEVKDHACVAGVLINQHYANLDTATRFTFPTLQPAGTDERRILLPETDAFLGREEEMAALSAWCNLGGWLGRGERQDQVGHGTLPR